MKRSRRSPLQRPPPDPAIPGAHPLEGRGAPPAASPGWGGETCCGRPAVCGVAPSARMLGVPPTKAGRYE